jgi:competence protein ComEA
LPETRTGRVITGIIIVLVTVIFIGGIIAWSRYEPGEPVEIYRMPDVHRDGIIFIGGAVNLPGYYPFYYEDTLDTLVRAAGGFTTGNNTLYEITLTFNDSTANKESQKIDINRAETWLLEALPGIGETLAKRIIEYRIENGYFNNTLELLEVDGIGSVVYEKIAPLITVTY